MRIGKREFDNVSLKRGLNPLQRPVSEFEDRSVRGESRRESRKKEEEEKKILPPVKFLQLLHIGNSVDRPIY